MSSKLRAKPLPSQAPLFWLALALVVGYCLPAGWALGLSGGGLLTLLALRKRWALPAFAWVSPVAMGVGVGLQVRQQPPVVPPVAAHVTVWGTLAQDARPTPYGYYSLLTLDSLQADGHSAVPSSARGVLYHAALPGEGLLLQGSRLRVVGTLRDLGAIRNVPYRTSLARQGFSFTLRADSLVALAPPAGVLGLRTRAATRLADLGLAAPSSALLRALVLGDRGGLAPEDRAAFLTSGTAHLLAVSGLHIAVVVYVLSWGLGLGRWRGRGWYLRAVAGLGLLVLCIPLTGGSPSVVRATLVVVLAWGALLLERKPVALNLLGASFLAQVVVNPWVLESLSFQLSYAAVTAILLGMPVVATALEGRPGWLRYPAELLALGCWAQLGTLPLQLLAFGAFSTYGLAVNLVAVPLSSLVLLLGVGCLALGGVPLIGPALVYLAGQSSALLLGLNRAVAEWPGAYRTGLAVAPWQAGLGAAALVGLGLWLYYRRGRGPEVLQIA
ncbi:MAG: ComEC/Rec2 family competence protein [Bacteroidia bacterium]|nr:ComEC/Rec2 family competence protein [Bacteroidia bacterium]